MEKEEALRTECNENEVNHCGKGSDDRDPPR